MKNKSDKKEFSLKYHKGTIIVVSVILLLTSSLLLIPFRGGRYTIPPRIYLEDIPINRDLSLREEIKNSCSYYNSKDLVINYRGEKMNIKTSDIGFRVDEEKTYNHLKSALSLENKFFLFKSLRWWEHTLWGLKVPIYYTFDFEKLEEFLENNFKVVLSPATDANLEIDDGTIRIIPAREGIGTDNLFLAAQILKNIKKKESGDIYLKLVTLQPKIPDSEASRLKETIEGLLAYPFAMRAQENVITLSRETLLSWIEAEVTQGSGFIKRTEADDIKALVNITLTNQSWLDYQGNYGLSWALNREAINSYLTQEIEGLVYQEAKSGVLAFEEGKIIETEPSHMGIRLDLETATDKIIESLMNKERFINLPVKEETPKISLKRVEELGIDFLVAEGESNFSGSPRNRRHNIAVGASKFNGNIIEQGAVFSFLDDLGDVDRKAGYLPELVIKHDKTVPEYGGGMCQVSTTCFRAAVQGGLRVVERQNHAYPVQYYSPQGTDATVYIPKPDLKFVNDTPGPLLIQTRIKGNILIFEYFGINDGRRVELEGPKTWDRRSDGAMKASWTQRVYNKEGELMFEKTFLSKYDSPNKYPHPEDEEEKEDKKKKKKKKKD